MMKLVRKDDHEVVIVGTQEIVPAMAHIAGADRGEDGVLRIHYDGSSEMYWDEQTTRLDDRGLRLFVDVHGEVLDEDEVELIA